MTHLHNNANRSRSEGIKARWLDNCHSEECKESRLRLLSHAMQRVALYQLICIAMQIVSRVMTFKTADWINVTPKNVKNLVCATCATHDAVCCSLPVVSDGVKPLGLINVTLISSATASTSHCQVLLFTSCVLAKTLLMYCQCRHSNGNLNVNKLNYEFYRGGSKIIMRIAQ